LSQQFLYRGSDTFAAFALFVLPATLDIGDRFLKKSLPRQRKDRRTSGGGKTQKTPKYHL